MNLTFCEIRSVSLDFMVEWKGGTLHPSAIYILAVLRWGGYDNWNVNWNCCHLGAI